MEKCLYYLDKEKKDCLIYITKNIDFLYIWSYFGLSDKIKLKLKLTDERVYPYIKEDNNNGLVLYISKYNILIDKEEKKQSWLFYNNIYIEKGYIDYINIIYKYYVKFNKLSRKKLEKTISIIPKTKLINKFKAKSIKTKKWIYGEKIQVGTDYYISNHNIKNEKIDPETSCSYVENIYDTNNIQIYTKDILKKINKKDDTDIEYLIVGKGSSPQLFFLYKQENIEKNNKQIDYIFNKKDFNKNKKYYDYFIIGNLIDNKKESIKNKKYNIKH